jgi:hypothetical protein
MDFNLALQDEYLFEKSSEKNEYWNRSSTLLEILSFATCLMQLKNVACNCTCCMQLQNSCMWDFLVA